MTSTSSVFLVAAMVLGLAAGLSGCAPAPHHLHGEIATTNIIFATSGDQASTVWIVHANGSGLRKLRTDAFSGAKLSPDGTSLVMNAETEDTYVVTDLDGNTLHQFQGCYKGDEISWTPDGNAILFGCYFDGLYRYDLTDSALTRFHVSPYRTYDHEPVMSPDQKWIAFTHNEWGTRYYINLIDPDGGNFRQIAKGVGPDDSSLYLMWLDNTHVLFTPGGTIHCVDVESNIETVIDPKVAFWGMVPRFDKSLLALQGDRLYFTPTAGIPAGRVRVKETESTADGYDFLAWSRDGGHYVARDRYGGDPSEPEQTPILRIFTMSGYEYALLTLGQFPNEDPLNLTTYDVFSVDWGVADRP